MTNSLMRYMLSLKNWPKTLVTRILRERKGMYAIYANTENSIQLSHIMKRMDALATDVGELKQQRAYVGEH